MGTGIIVTRAASDAQLSTEVLSQVTSFPKTLGLVAVALGGLLFVAGTPALPTATLSAAALVIAAIPYRVRKATAKATPSDRPPPGGDAAAPCSGDDGADALLALEPVEVHLGSKWLPLATQPESPFTERIAAFRKQYAQESGMVLPRVRFRDSAKLQPDRYEIRIDGAPCAKGEARVDRPPAIHQRATRAPSPAR